MKYRLTLWLRTLLEGPMCQRCETRHWDTDLGRMMCRTETAWDDLETRAIQNYGDIAP